MSLLPVSLNDYIVPRCPPWENVRLLPFPVRYAISHRRGVLTPEDMRDLITAEFIDEAVYVVAKALVPFPEKHYQFIKRVVELFGEREFNLGLFRCQAERMTEGVTVTAGKLKQLSWQGFKSREEEYDTRILNAHKEGGRLTLESPDDLLGLSYVLQSAGSAFYLVIPEWLKDESNFYDGYTIYPHEKEVYPRPKYVRVRFVEK